MKKFLLLFCVSLLAGCQLKAQVIEKKQPLQYDILQFEIEQTKNGFDFELFANLHILNPSNHEITILASKLWADEVQSYFIHEQEIPAQEKVVIPGSFYDIAAAIETKMLEYEYAYEDHYYKVNLEEQTEYAFQVPVIPKQERVLVSMSQKGFRIADSYYSMEEFIAITRYYERQRYFRLETEDSTISNEDADAVKLQLEEIGINSVETVNYPFAGAC